MTIQTLSTALFTVVNVVILLFCAGFALQNRIWFGKSRILREFAKLEMQVVDLEDLYGELNKRQRKIAQRQTMRERRDKQQQEETPEDRPALTVVPSECPDPNVDPAGFKAWHRKNSLPR